MQPLQQQLRNLSEKLQNLSAATRQLLTIGVAVLLAVLIAVFVVSERTPNYQLVFGNLPQDDVAQAGAVLKGGNIPFRVEATGTTSALMVPTDKVYDARLLLSSQGLPRAAGVGYEITDGPDIGSSVFKQNINLQRATEGELARTISSLDEVQAARVHIATPRRDIFIDVNNQPSASVVLRMHPGRHLSPAQVQGIRHLVAAAIPNLPTNRVAVVDQTGKMLSGDEAEGAFTANDMQRGYESGLEKNIQQLLEPAVGAKNVVVKVSATFDYSQLESTTQQYDPDRVVVLNQRNQSQQKQQQDQKQLALTGAAANNAANPAAPPQGPTSNSQEQNVSTDESIQYGASNLIEKRVNKSPRLSRLSVAVLLGGTNNTPLGEDEINRLADLTRHAIGFDEKRGDQLQITSVPTLQAPAEDPLLEEIPEKTFAEYLPMPWQQMVIYGSVGLVGLLVLIFGGRWLAARMRAQKELAQSGALLKTGATVSQVEQAIRQKAAEPPPEPLDPVVDPQVALRQRAQELARIDPVRTARLLSAWITNNISDTPPIEAIADGKSKKEATVVNNDQAAA